VAVTVGGDGRLLSTGATTQAGAQPAKESEKASKRAAALAFLFVRALLCRPPNGIVSPAVWGSIARCMGLYRPLFDVV